MSFTGIKQYSEQSQSQWSITLNAEMQRTVISNVSRTEWSTFHGVIR